MHYKKLNCPDNAASRWRRYRHNASDERPYAYDTACSYAIFTSHRDWWGTY